MARKKQSAETPAEQEPTENPEDMQEAESSKPVSPLRNLVRPLPEGEWDTLVDEMHDYITTNNTMVERSLTRNRAIAEKFTAFRKTVRGSAQTKSGIVLRDDMPAKEPEPEEKINLNELYKHGRIKRKK